MTDEQVLEITLERDVRLEGFIAARSQFFIIVASLFL